MRRLVETNLLPEKPSSVSLDEFNRLYDVATSRISWARDTVFQFWNAPDSSTKAIEASTHHHQQQQQQRPISTGPVMDAEWWFWNIAFALLPAFLIATYCEFRGQPRMRAYERRREIEELKRVMGDDFIIPPELEEEVPIESFAQRLRKVAREVSFFFSGAAGELSEGEAGDGTAKEGKKEEDTQREGAKVSAPMTRAVDAKKDVSTETAPPTAPSRDELTERSLLDRVAKLEAIVQEQRERRLRDVHFELDRLRQSGVQNRMDDEVRDSQLRRSKRNDEEKQSPGKTLAIWSSITLENVNSAFEHVQSILRRKKIEAKDETPGETTSDGKERGTDTKRESQKSSNLSSNSDASTQSKEINVLGGKKEKPDVSEGRRETEAPTPSHLGGSDSKNKPWWKVW